MEQLVSMKGSHYTFLQRPTSRRQWQAAGKGDALCREGPTGDSQSIDALDSRDLLVHAGELMGCVRGQGGCRAGTSWQVHLHSKDESVGHVGGHNGCWAGTLRQVYLRSKSRLVVGLHEQSGWLLH